MPAGVGTRIVFSLLGISLLIIRSIQNNPLKNLIMPIRTVFMLGITFLLICVALLSCYINGTHDLTFIRVIIGFFLSFLGAYFVITCLSASYTKISFQLIAQYIIVAATLQVILALLMFLVPAVRDLVTPVLDQGEFIDDLLQSAKEFRIIGIASNPFAVGLTNCLALMLICTLIRTEKSRIKVALYTFGYCIILSIGSMMSRTTIIGGAISLIILFWPEALITGKLSTKMLTFLLTIVIIVMAVYLIILLLPPDILEGLSAASSYGFEVFINYINGKGVQSDSTNELQEMFIWPSKMQTYLIGDGLFADPKDPVSYYMGTDVGYLRLIYFFGIPGMLLFFILQLYPIFVLAATRIIDKHELHFYILTAVFLLIANIKGEADIFFFMALFLFVPYIQTRLNTDIKLKQF